MLTLINELGPHTRFGRAQGWRDPMDLMHEWALTFIQFQAGKKVTTPSFMRGIGNGTKRASADEIKKFLSDATGQPPSDSGGFAFPSL